MGEIWANLGNIWKNLVKNWLNLPKIRENLGKIWAKSKSCIPKKIRSLYGHEPSCPLYKPSLA